MLLRSISIVLAAMLSMATVSIHAAPADDGPVYGPRLEGFTYPAPVKLFKFESQGNALEMAYLDVPPVQSVPPNGQVAVLLHGKNFCAATWEGTIQALTGAGYRVIAPDQIGFCKSSKPHAYQYSFQQLASNTHALLASLGIERAIVIGHSTGGMLATRYALMYPNAVSRLVMINPIGLEDWKAKGVPSMTVDQWFAREKQTTAERIRAYEQSTYYAGQWRAAYEPWVQMLAGMYRGPGRDLVAWNSALLYDMIYTQPVVYEFGQVRPWTLLLIGQKDTTAIGKDMAAPEMRAHLGNYPELGRATVKAIPRATLVEFPDAGHAPQIQDSVALHKAVLEWLASPDASRTRRPD
ncbi:alpha/beta fold hydrolase [Ralstonia sp. UBA689]|uniref:alpha/beta fold hydrolase n=1 Tax=Ralstonia sp. UBA689 TaxID=1947373 RepID=UPI0025F1E43B|nr:alpha/beta hydrolase [Ralstonia sp. UBA689]